MKIFSFCWNHKLNGQSKRARSRSRATKGEPRRGLEELLSTLGDGHWDGFINCGEHTTNDCGFSARHECFRWSLVSGFTTVQSVERSHLS